MIPTDTTSPPDQPVDKHYYGRQAGAKRWNVSHSFGYAVGGTPDRVLRQPGIHPDGYRELLLPVRLRPEADIWAFFYLRIRERTTPTHIIVLNAGKYVAGKTNANPGILRCALAQIGHPKYEV